MAWEWARPLLCCEVELRMATSFTKFRTVPFVKFVAEVFENPWRLLCRDRPGVSGF